MPRTIFDQRSQKIDKLVVLLRGTAYADGKSFMDLCDMIQLSPKTVRSRFKKPETFTLGELRRLSKGLNIPADDIRQSINF